MNKQLRKAFQFFYAHDEYATPPGRAVCALESARIDVLRDKLESAGRIEFKWVADEDADAGPRDWGWSEKQIGDFYDREHEVAGCILVVDGEETESLWGIWDASPEYRRCIETDLLSQYISTQGTGIVPVYYPGGTVAHVIRQLSFSHMLTA